MRLWSDVMFILQMHKSKRKSGWILNTTLEDRSQNTHAKLPCRTWECSGGGKVPLGISSCLVLTVRGKRRLIDILFINCATLLSHTQNLPPAKWSWLTNIPDILMLRLHVATPLPCPHSVSLGGSLAAPSWPTGEDGRRRLKRHTGAQQHLPVAAFSQPRNFDPLLHFHSQKITLQKRKLHYLVRSKWWATTTAPLHTRPETMTEIFEHTKSQAKFPAERVKRKPPPSVSQSCGETAWRDVRTCDEQ